MVVPRLPVAEGYNNVIQPMGRDAGPWGADKGTVGADTFLSLGDGPWFL